MSEAMLDAFDGPPGGALITEPIENLTREPNKLDDEIA
jgi:hypothetical protein